MMVNRIFALVLCSIILCNEIYSTQLPDVIETTSGLVRGNVLQTPFSNTTFRAYRGIPYAEAPIGKRRFKAPEPFQARKGKIIEAFKYGPACFQSSGGVNTLHESENCLSINVFVPVRSRRKIAFIYGGAFSKGHSTDILYGPDFLVEKGVIFVSFNYRSGALGFMSLGIKGFTGNMGLKDQQLALKWIHDNIEHFGGNKDEVTLFGHSAGSASAHYHLLNKESRNYFKRIVLMSGVVMNYFTRSIMVDHKQIMREFAKTHIGRTVSSDDDLISLLQTVDVRNITAYKRFDESMSVLETIWAPVYDGLYAIPEYDNETFVKNSPEKLYEEYEAEGVEKATLFSYTSMEAFIVNIFNDPTKMQHLNKNFHFTLPFHGFTRDKYEKKYDELMQKIKHFYFASASIDKDSIFKYFNLLSDVNFAYGINKAVKLHANKSSSPTYYLRFSVSGLFSNLKKKLATYQHDTPGCGHGEERYYIFKATPLQSQYKGLYVEKDRFKDSGIAFDTLEYMTELLSSFAKIGRPNIGSSHFHEFPAVRSDSTAFVDITNDGVVTGFNPNERAFQFWREVEKEIIEEMNKY